MINVSRPINVFSFTLVKDFVYRDQTIEAGHVLLKRGEPLDNGFSNPEIFVYTLSNYNTPSLTVNDKFVKELMTFIKFKQIEDGDYGDYGNDDMT